MAKVFHTDLTIAGELRARLANLHEPTEEELREQRISWVYGNLWESFKAKGEIRDAISSNRLVPPARRKAEPACASARRGHRRDGKTGEGR